MSDARTQSDVRSQSNAGQPPASDQQPVSRESSQTLPGSAVAVARGHDGDGIVSTPPQGWRRVVEVLLLMTLFFIYAGDSAPMVNEAHYLVKAKNYWDPGWCSEDMFVASAKVHTTFYVLFGWPTKYLSLTQTAWLGRLVGWLLLAIGLQRLSWGVFRQSFVSPAVAVLWIAGVEYGNLAGEWVVGGIEAKVPAYGLILLALSYLIERRWNWVWILLGSAAAFHVLSGGWAVIAVMGCWWMTERMRPDGIKLFTPALFVGGAISLFGLVPALSMSLGADSGQAAMAARIYSYFRIKHHLLPADFYLAWYLRFGALVLMMVGGFAIYGKRVEAIRILGWFVSATVGISVVGLLLGFLPSYAPDLAAKLLRYYWFRLADAMVPLMVAVLVVRMVLDQRHRIRLIGLAGLLLAVVLCGNSVWRSASRAVPPAVSNDLLGIEAGASAEVQQQVYADWLNVCRWARSSSGEQEVFLTPRNQQTFKWFAGRAEVVNWKDVPQNPSALLEWYERFKEVYPSRIGNRRTANRVSIRYPSLLALREKYGVRYLIVDRRVTGDNLPLLRIYPADTETNQTYAVYELPYPPDGMR
ncbi:hypothetical protein OAG34_00305 [bacterium]|nr:hypothetical protein [bacterium]